MTPALQLRLIGTPALLLPGGEVRLLDRHGALIAARLALAGPQPRRLLAGLLWPDVPPARARANLRQRLLRLKDLANSAWIVGYHTLSLLPGVRWDRPDALVPGMPAPVRHLELLEGVDEPESDALAAVQQMMIMEPPSDWRVTFADGTLSITAVPEPATWALWLAGLVAVARIARRRAV